MVSQQLCYPTKKACHVATFLAMFPRMFPILSMMIGGFHKLISCTFDMGIDATCNGEHLGTLHSFDKQDLSRKLALTDSTPSLAIQHDCALLAVNAIIKLDVFTTLTTMATKTFASASCEFDVTKFEASNNGKLLDSAFLSFSSTTNGEPSDFSPMCPNQVYPAIIALKMICRYLSSLVSYVIFHMVLNLRHPILSIFHSRILKRKLSS